jgi:hypothetical protein
MQEQIEIPCSWSQCDSAATKHVRFGNRTFGVHDILPAPDQNYTVLHRNLCDKHVEEIKGQYMDVSVFEIGECPSCRR